MTSNQYDAHSIRVLKEDEMENFPYHLIEILAEKYVKPLEAVKRGVEVSFMCGMKDASYFEERYLKGDRSVPENETYTNLYKEVLLKERELNWIQKS